MDAFVQIVDYGGQGVFMWLLTLILVAVLAFLFAKGLDADELKLTPSRSLGIVQRRRSRGHAG